MSLDQIARNRAAGVREQTEAIALPESGTVIRRARHRRMIGSGAVVVALVIVAAALMPAMLRVIDDNTPGRIRATSPAPARGSWARVSKDAAGIAGSTIHALVSDGTTLVADGEPAHGARQVTALWWSPDGLHWNLADHPEQQQGVTALAAHDGTAIAIGAPGGPNQYVLRSIDGGRSWTQIGVGNVFGSRFGPGGTTGFGPGVSNLTWQRGSWIASGNAVDGTQAIWISKDGATWRPTQLEGASLGTLSGVVATGNGGLMAYGLHANENADGGSTAWFTKDPTAWGTPVGITGPGGAVLLGSVADGAGLATGRDGSTDGGTPALRSSDGGRTWSEANAFRARFPDVGVVAAARVDGTEVLVGTASVGGPASLNIAGYPPAAWVSANGRTWTALPPRLAPTTDPGYLHGTLDLVAAIGRRIVMMSSDANLNSYFTFDRPTARTRR